ncbi:phosphatidylserine decarboxylase [Acidihalobacter prosperus]|uniref:Phosphatidylserine decarboxylase n=1 Tax=Acidihalobacter prosperus TaxID=160660 RepID=A0A1A6C5C4_9GAMM|nr:hypothetical protein [Acidihalobacter prosperus]OBS09749.1 hypothetical protein Thpro_020799 [Acidihalobacter prosperus]
MMPIVREGRVPVFGLLALALALTATENVLIAAPLWIGTFVLAFVFRELPRRAPASPLAVLSPVDGRVLSVESCRDPYRERSSQCVRVVQDAAGPYGLYAPIEGKLLKVWHGSPAAKEHQAALWVQTDELDDIVVAVHRSRLPGYLRCRAHAGERVGHGSRCGFAGFGRIVELYLPEASRVEVEAGARLRAGQVIGKLLRP